MFRVTTMKTLVATSVLAIGALASSSGEPPRGGTSVHPVTVLLKNTMGE